ncbi:unnamed protein product, partial [Hapterophycus canaliculatus]
ITGQAAKKAAKAREDAANLYYPIIFCVNLIYILYRGIWGFRTFGRWEICGLAVTSIVYYVCYHGMLEAAKRGVAGGAYFDILVVCLAGQFVSAFSGYGIYVYLLVPSYYTSLLAYWVFRKLRAWMQSQHLQNMSEDSSARDLKRLAKKERKAAKAPKVRMR